jgi:hypothetical protein
MSSNSIQAVVPYKTRNLPPFKEKEKIDAPTHTYLLHPKEAFDWRFYISMACGDDSNDSK